MAHNQPQGGSLPPPATSFTGISSGAEHSVWGRGAAISIFASPTNFEEVMKKTSKKRTVKITTVWILSGWAVAFSDRCEFWQHNPEVLTKRQLKQLGIIGYKRFAETVKTGEGLGR